MMLTKIPVLLLTGYLGSGKTTLLNRILSNKRGIKFAVIVNDIGEVNIDAELIQKEGVVTQEDDGGLLALQNGCICCTLKMDLVQQLQDILAMKKFDYIVIEASGICEPAPIAQTICSIPDMGAEYVVNGMPVLDSIVTVVDALRMRDEFASGKDLMRRNIDEEDIANLLIQQIEFCNRILLNKASEVTPEELRHVTEVIRALQPDAEIIPCDYGEVDLDKLIHTQGFDFEKVATSATWVKKVEGMDEEDEHEHHHEHHHEHEHEHHDHEHHHEHHHDHDHDHEHEHHDHDHDHEHHHHEHGPECTCGCHHHHDHDHGEAEEYGIGTFVYKARRPFDLGLFDDFVARLFPKNVIRAKGMCYFADERDMCYVFEQAGRQVSLKQAGQWFATMPAEELEDFVRVNPQVMRDWDPEYGDRMQKLVFIGQKLDKAAITEMLDRCLV